jgi:CDP-glucose 4,6-dehydratase
VGERRGTVEEMVSPDREFWRGRRVLLTGHTGFKGAWLALWLSELGAKVTGLALPPQTSPNLFTLARVAERTNSMMGDICDLATVRAGFASFAPEVVFHLAAQALVGKSYAEPVETYRTNVLGAAHVLEAVRETESVAAAVIVTSDKCYENKERAEPYREGEPLGGKDPYSSSKACAELVTSAYRNSFFRTPDSCRIASARAGNVIGGGDWAAERLLPDLVRAFAAGQSTAIRSAAAVRPWQHVLEPLAGYVGLAERLAGEGGEGYARAWNFGPAEEDCRPVSYLADAAASRWGEGARWHVSEKAHAPEAGILKVDSRLVQEKLGWRRRMRLDTAIEWAVDWYRRQLAGEDAAALSLAQIAAYEKRAEFPG